MGYLGHVTHFGHKNITGPTVSNWGGGYRDFNSIEEMDQTIINTFNKYVKEDDIVFHLGDFNYISKQPAWYYRNKLICKNIHLIMGNHDNDGQVSRANFTTVSDLLEVELGKLKLFLSHYSHRVFNGSHKGTLHCFGHYHSTLDYLPWGKSMDVGIDSAYKLFGEYRPFNLATDIIPIMDKRDIKFVDSHNSKTNN